MGRGACAPFLTMKKEKRELLTAMIEKNLAIDEILEISSTLKHYLQECVNFQNSTTPESEALARWGKEIWQREWVDVVKRYELPKYPIYCFLESKDYEKVPNSRT